MEKIDNIPVRYIKGVGEKTADRLRQFLGIQSVQDLLYYFPRAWEDRSKLKKISELIPGENVTIKAKVKSVSTEMWGRNLAIFKAELTDSTGTAVATWVRRFTRSYDVLKPLKNNVKVDSEVFITGSVEKDFWCKIIRVADYEAVTKDEKDLINTNRIVPVYPLTEDFNNKFLRTIVKTALDKYINNIQGTLPEKYVKKYSLCDMKFAIQNIHFPDNFESKDKARKRLAFNEFLNLELVLEKFRQHRKKIIKNFKYNLTKNLLTPFKKKLPFEFTDSQKKVINEIFESMMSEHPMNRLLQGDVGSGKTVVALSSMLLAVESGFQSILLAPTEILAEQHFLTIKKLLEGMPVEVDLIFGKMLKKKKTDIKKRVADGVSNIIIGTHAILQEDIKFKKLALIVIDEQHRFGVEQRLKIKKKSIFLGSDLLMMTATPIPRTLGLTLYGDLDISTLNELPPGRFPVKTIEMPGKNAYNFIRDRVKHGEQAFIVYPLVDESEKLQLKSAVKEAESLKETEFKDFSVGLIHGRLKPEEKEKIMAEFAQKKYNVLISTTVIEVGIDIPNATVMVIEHADRYGLSTLHQLRGRVGRSNKESYCILLGEAKTDNAKRRLDVLTKTNDGFKIAEEDLMIRGPGEFFGTEQSGLPSFKVGNILTDLPIIREAKETAIEMLKNEPESVYSILAKSKEDYLNKNIEFGEV
ncbi:MAG: ATP-dependent DNA helicase RecG [Elusimicrobia bacterium RIFOXYD2_FULL_34_15]|nr:MAG: ATP-dependent DNA helicase RecG [Elusimicrobia bacterium RIFOXYD2_FULL_34_15]